MARRYDSRRVKIHRSYDVSEVAGLLDVHKRTVERWIKAGLPLVAHERPSLIHGSDLRAFLAALQPRKQPCRKGEIFCVGCREPKRPAGGAVEHIPRSATTVLVAGICPDCDRMIYRVAKVSVFASTAAISDVARQHAQERLIDSRAPISNADFRKQCK